MPPHPNGLTKNDGVVIAVIIGASIAAQVLAAVYFEATGSLLALAASALVFLIWVLLRFRPKS